MQKLMESNVTLASFTSHFRRHAAALLLAASVTGSGWAQPVIDPVGSVTIPAGKSLILPITATSPSGLPLTYTVASSTNGIAVILHTNNPFWQLSVAQAAATNAPGAYLTPFRDGMATVTNLGNLTFMLFPEYAPHTVNVFQGLTLSGFFNSNTIFHRVVANTLIQGGDPLTNGTGHLVFTYDDEYHPEVMFSGSGQLALANAGKNANGSQFFVTQGAQRNFDFCYPLFGQLVRGFDVLTNVANTGLDTNSRPLAEVIIQQAGFTNDTMDTVITLTATNVPGVSGTITLIAADGAGGLATNTFAVRTVADINTNNQPIFYPNTVTNLVGPKNVTLTNSLTAVELDNDLLYWYPAFADQASANGAPNSEDYGFNTVFKTLTYNVKNTNGGLGLLLRPAANYVGPVTVYFDVSYNYNANWWLYKQFGLSVGNYTEKIYTFVFGDTPITGQSNVVAALASVPFTNVLLATFTNGVTNSTAANFSAVINWGDDTTSSGIITANAAGQKGVQGSHAFAYPGNHPVYVEVQSAIGASTTFLSFVNVTSQSAPATNSLTVLVNGRGTVAPAYTNTPLAVGASYSVSATGASNYFLLNWTDNHGFVLGTGTNLTFTMSPGLTVTANFILITTPGLAFAAPVPGQVLTNLYSAPVTVSGVASNTATISAVWYQANSGGWHTASGTTRWTAEFMPEYGVTNVIQAYAANEFGFVSPTNTLHVKYLAGDILKLGTNGLGSITPNLNGQLLPLGTNYALTAAPAVGFVFTNWTMYTNWTLVTNSTVATNWLGGVATNGRAFRFVMQTNLTLVANFVETNHPILSVTNLVAGQRISNAVFTVKGKASDNWQVVAVHIQLNSGGWTNAAGTAAWSALLNLIPGTNTVQAYAVSESGNVSPTTSITFIYVPSAVLRVTVVGQGTLTPNYNGALLALGETNTMQAKAINGFAFASWAEGTNLTTNATLTFIMSTNLALTAKFVDVTKPVATITYPAANQKWSNSVITATGKATDNAGVAAVWCQINQGAWAAAQTSNGFTNWTATNLPVQFGTNSLQAYAVDAAGNVSPTNSVSFIYVPSAVLKVNVVGQGTLTPNYNGVLLALGGTYTMQAKAINGFAFYHWTEMSATSTNMSTNTTLPFIMSTNLTLTANFVDVTKPVATITYPAANQKCTNSAITATGKATDNAGVAEVWCQINQGGWAAAQTSNGFTNWTATNLPVRFGTNILQAYAVDAAGNLSITNAVNFLGGLAPASLAGYQGTLKPSAGTQAKNVTWSDDTWSQTGTVGDTNANDYCAGSYDYFRTGPNTAVISNLDIGMLSSLNTTNNTTVYLTFTSTGTANCTWTNGHSSGAGIMTFSTVTELVPASLAGTILKVSTNGVVMLTTTFGSDGSFSEVETGGTTHAGNYTLTPCSPTTAILQLNYTDPSQTGAVSYAELTFVSASSGEVFESHYAAANQSAGSNPNKSKLGTFNLTQ